MIGSSHLQSEDRYFTQHKLILKFAVFQTRIFVTHGVGFLPQVDQIIVLQNGRISEVSFGKEG